MKILFWKLSIRKAEKPDPRWFVPWSEEISRLDARCMQLELDLAGVSRQTEATRKKVYRDGAAEDPVLEARAIAKELAPVNQSIRPGDPMQGG